VPFRQPGELGHVCASISSGQAGETARTIPHLQRYSISRKFYWPAMPAENSSNAAMALAAYISDGPPPM
jgi:hypothetical protein